MGILKQCLAAWSRNVTAIQRLNATAVIVHEIQQIHLNLLLKSNSTGSAQSLYRPGTAEQGGPQKCSTASFIKNTYACRICPRPIIIHDSNIIIAK